MKYVTLALLGIGLAIGSSIAQGQAPKSKDEPELKTIEQKFAYAYGLNLGRTMKRSSVMLDADILAKGIKDGLADKPGFGEKELQEIQVAFQKILEEKQAAIEAAAKTKDIATLAAEAGPEAEKALKAGRDFLAKNKNQPGIKVLPSGVQYKVLKSGTGKSPAVTDTVFANYRGTLIDGTEFDSSAKHGGPSDFPVNRVIAGWTEVLQLMKVGDKWQVFIPTELAYGARPRPGIIKPFDALIFDMELVKIADDK
jgi:FKBP-type peptidyl-prolyl cis-trans isomerase FklB